MDIEKDWLKIQKHFIKSFQSNFHVAIASVDPNHLPTITPIGSLFLNSDQTGFYFEKYASRLSRCAETNPNICIMAVYSNTWFWIRSLYLGKFPDYPAIRLFGALGERRKAEAWESKRLKRRMKMTTSLKGHQYLWGDMDYVREIKFTRAEKSNLGLMTRAL